MDPDFFLRRYPISVEFHRLLMGVLAVDPAKRTTLREFIATVHSIGANNFTYHSNPGKLFASRAEYLRLMDTKLIRTHVEQELSGLLDTNRFLREYGLDGAVVSSETDKILFLRQLPKLPGYVCSFATPRSVKNWVDFGILASNGPPVLRNAISTPLIAEQTVRGDPPSHFRDVAISCCLSSACDTISSPSDMFQELGMAPMTPRSVVRDGLENCASSFDLQYPCTGRYDEDLGPWNTPTRNIRAPDNWALATQQSCA